MIGRTSGQPVATVEELVEQFAQDPRSSGVDVPALTTLLVNRQEFDEQPDAAQWRPGDVAELLLSLAPRKVTADDQFLSAAPAALGAFLGFLDASGKLRAPWTS